MRRLNWFCIITCSLLSVVSCKECGRLESGWSLDKIDCHPEANANEGECLRRGCCWLENDNGQTDDRPSCFFPADFNCYNIVMQASSSDSDGDRHELSDRSADGHDKHLESRQAKLSGRRSGLTWLLERKPDCPASGFHDDAKRLKLELHVYGQSIVNIKISEPDRQRFEPKLPEINLPDGMYNSGSNKKVESSSKDADDNLLLFGGESKDDDLLRVELNSENGLLRMIHQNSSKILFEIPLQRLIYSRQFIQLPTRLGSSLVYGLGQHMGESLLKSKTKTYTMFNYGHPPQPDGRTSYSSYPFYVNVAPLSSFTGRLQNGSDSGHMKPFATGALMLNSNAMDVVVRSSGSTSASGSVTWRMVGGLVDLFLFAGPEPHDVISQYQSLVGFPSLPPAWALGYHQSRHNYRYLLQIKQAWARTRAAGIPMESLWTDLDFLRDSNSYSLGTPELPELVDIFQKNYGMHYMTIVDPTISLAENSSYEPLKLAKSLSLFAYNQMDGQTGESSPAVVSSWLEKAGLLDFTHSDIVAYLVKILKEYKQQLNFDGLWLDMNEPEILFNEADGEGVRCAHDEELQYWPGKRRLNDRTLCMEAQFDAGKHYDLHNLYAFYQSKAHYEALKRLNSSRPFLVSRAQFVGQGKYAGAWLGDLGSNFEHMKWSLLGTIESNWFGQPMIGADICGFFGSTSDELCSRWFSLGAFYPLARNHNDGSAKDQDPGALNEDVERSARVALLKRYSLLPFLYSLFYENHLRGIPVISSVAFSFFDNFQMLEHLSEPSGSDHQLVWGGSLLIAPVVEAGQVTRHIHLPPGRWYDVSIGLPGTDLSEGPYDGLRSNWPTQSMSNGIVEKHLWTDKVESLRKPISCRNGCLLWDHYTPLGSLNVYQRGGSIIPTFRHVKHTDSISRLWSAPTFFLEIALNETAGATGSLYWDSGDSDPGSSKYDKVAFRATKNQLTLTMLENNYSDHLKFDGFIVYGAVLTEEDTPSSSVFQNIRMVRDYDPDRNILTCRFKSLLDAQDEYLMLRKDETLVLAC